MANRDWNNNRSQRRNRNYDPNFQMRYYNQDQNLDWDASNTNTRDWNQDYDPYWDRGYYQNWDDNFYNQRMNTQNRGRDFGRGSDQGYYENWDDNFYNQRVNRQNRGRDFGRGSDQGYYENWDDNFYNQRTNTQNRGREFGQNRDRGYYENWDDNFYTNRISSQNRDRGFKPDWNRDSNRSRNWNQGSNQDRNQSSNRNLNQNYSRNQNWDQDYDQDYDQGWNSDYPTYVYTEEYWFIPGPFEGIGPSGYQRSDDRISDDICDRLTEHGHIDATDIEVDVKDGVATLKGQVDNRQMKRMVEDLAESIPGVTDVHNELRVKRPQGRMGDQSNTMQGQQGMAGDQLYGRESTFGSQQGMNEETLYGREPTSGSDQSRMQSQQATMTGQQEQDRLKGKTGQAPGLRQQIHKGMQVIGSDGGSVGVVKEVRSDDFLVERTMSRDVYIPFSACQLDGDQVKLNIPVDQIDNQNWPSSSIL